MGRTVPSYRLSLEAEIQSWKSFRDMLRIDEREVFDDLTNLKSFLLRLWIWAVM